MPRWFLLLCKVAAGTTVSILQAYAFLAIAAAFGIRMPALGYLTVLPALILSGLMLGAFGLMLSSWIRQLENFAGVMNFVIFPTFFLSSALYPLWKMLESSRVIHAICVANPFTYAVELIRFSLYLQLNLTAAAIVVAALAVFSLLAVLGYDPRHGLVRRQTV